MGFRRAKSTQGNTNCQKNIFEDDQVPGHHPRALTTTVDQDEQPTDSQITTETPVLHPRTTTIDVPVLTSSASHPEKVLTDKTDFWALVGCGAALALLAVINVHFFRKKCRRRQLR